MNRRLIAPLAAILVLIGKELLGIEVSNEDMEIVIEVCILAAGGIGALGKPKKKAVPTPKDEE